MTDRKHTKCKLCGDLLWFDVLQPPEQAVSCPCGAAGLTEDGPVGEWEEPTQEEIDSIP